MVGVEGKWNRTRVNTTRKGKADENKGRKEERKVKLGTDGVQSNR